MTLNFPQDNNSEGQMRRFLLQLREIMLPKAQKLAKYDAQLADITISDVLYKVYKNIDEWKEKTPFFPRLFRALNNQFIDHYRQEAKAKKTISLEVVPEIENNFSNDDVRILEQKELMGAAKVYVETLNPTLQEVFRMYFIEGMDHEEIALAKNISKDHSRQNLSRLIKKLRQEFN